MQSRDQFLSEGKLRAAICRRTVVVGGAFIGRKRPVQRYRGTVRSLEEVAVTQSLGTGTVPIPGQRAFHLFARDAGRSGRRVDRIQAIADLHQLISHVGIGVGSDRNRSSGRAGNGDLVIVHVAPGDPGGIHRDSQVFAHVLPGKGARQPGDGQTFARYSSRHCGLRGTVIDLVLGGNGGRDLLFRNSVRNRETARIVALAGHCQLIIACIGGFCSADGIVIGAQCGIVQRHPGDRGPLLRTVIRKLGPTRLGCCTGQILGVHHHGELRSIGVVIVGFGVGSREGSRSGISHRSRGGIVPGPALRQLHIGQRIAVGCRQTGRDFGRGICLGNGDSAQLLRLKVFMVVIALHHVPHRVGVCIGGGGQRLLEGAALGKGIHHGAARGGARRDQFLGLFVVGKTGHNRRFLAHAGRGLRNHHQDAHFHRGVVGRIVRREDQLVSTGIRHIDGRRSAIFPTPGAFDAAGILGDGIDIRRLAVVGLGIGLHRNLGHFAVGQRNHKIDGSILIVLGTDNHRQRGGIARSAFAGQRILYGAIFLH